MDHGHGHSDLRTGFYGILGRPTQGPRCRDLRGRLVAALGTTDPEVIAAAMGEYAGSYRNLDEYVRTRLGEYLPPGFGWLLACCDPELLRRHYETEVVRVWTIPADDGGVLVFEGDAPRGAE